MAKDTLCTGAALDSLRCDYADTYEGLTVLVNGAEGFMGSHVTVALAELSAPLRQ